MAWASCALEDLQTICFCLEPSRRMQRSLISRETSSSNMQRTCKEAEGDRLAG